MPILQMVIVCFENKYYRDVMKASLSGSGIVEAYYEYPSLNTVLKKEKHWSAYLTRLNIIDLAHAAREING